jgi:hypothetical protein
MKRTQRSVTKALRYLLALLLLAGVTGQGFLFNGAVRADTTYVLNISSTSGGNVTAPGEGSFSYSENATVDLVAEADSGYGFAGWTGDTSAIGDVNSLATTIVISDNYTIIANFAPLTTSVTITDNGNPGLDFGHLDAGAIKQPEANLPLPSITIENNGTAKVGVFLKATDFTGPGGATIPVSNIFYNSTNNSSPATAMTANYSSTSWKDINPAHSIDIYHWLSVPGGTPVGDYTANFTYKVE